MALVPAFTEKPQQQEVRQGILVLVLVREMSHHNTQVSTGPTVQSARPELVVLVSILGLCLH